jgi:hypothetical protein
MLHFLHVLLPPTFHPVTTTSTPARQVTLNNYRPAQFWVRATSSSDTIIHHARAVALLSRCLSG